MFGVPGSGKSFFCKMEMGNVFLGTDDEIIVIDPMNEYFDIAHTYGGTVVNMSTYTDNYVNPLDMDVWSLDLNDSKGMIREKGEFMLGLCEQCMGESLNSRQKSIIDRCVRKLYIDIARSREKYVPVMSDFYEILMNQPEEEAKDIALSLELFVNGSLNIFNHQTNVDVDNRFTVYGIRDLGTELSPITMLVMMESIQNHIIANGNVAWQHGCILMSSMYFLIRSILRNICSSSGKRLESRAVFVLASRRMSWIFCRTTQRQPCLQTPSLLRC